jgi:hypothetical protein
MTWNSAQRPNAAGTQLFLRPENYLEPKMKTPRHAGAFEVLFDVLIDEGDQEPFGLISV